MAAHLCRGLQHTRAKTLTRHFHQAKAGNAAHLNTRAIGFQLVFHPLFNGVVIAAFIHIDEVDHNQTCQIAQAQLARNLIGGLKVGFRRSLFDRAFFGRATRVDVNRHQRLCDADHDIAA